MGALPVGKAATMGRGLRGAVGTTGGWLSVPTVVKKATCCAVR